MRQIAWRTHVWFVYGNIARILLIHTRVVPVISDERWLRASLLGASFLLYMRGCIKWRTEWERRGRDALQALYHYQLPIDPPASVKCQADIGSTHSVPHACEASRVPLRSFKAEFKHSATVNHELHLIETLWKTLRLAQTTREGFRGGCCILESFQARRTRCDTCARARAFSHFYDFLRASSPRPFQV